MVDQDHAPTKAFPLTVIRSEVLLFLSDVMLYYGWVL